LCGVNQQTTDTTTTITTITFHGHLYRLVDGEWLRPATATESIESAIARRAGINHSGAIMVDGVSCYIAQ